MKPVFVYLSLIACETFGGFSRILLNDTQQVDVSLGYAFTTPHRTNRTKIFSALSLMPTSDPYDAKQLTHLH
jgi:hypothetical protein